MKPKSTKSPAVWVVVVRCNLDDVIAGSFLRIADARQRMQQILDGTAKPVPSARRDMVTWDESGLIGVAIYRVQGVRVAHWEQKEFGDEGREAA